MTTESIFTVLLDKIIEQGKTIQQLEEKINVLKKDKEYMQSLYRLDNEFKPHCRCKYWT